MIRLRRRRKLSFYELYPNRMYDSALECPRCGGHLWLSSIPRGGWDCASCGAAKPEHDGPLAAAPPGAIRRISIDPSAETRTFS